MAVLEKLSGLIGGRDLRDDAGSLEEGVRQVYSAAALDPQGAHPFPVGRAFAESVGYGRDLLDSLPPASWESFAGVSNVSIFADIPEGTSVIDVGCGAGLDCLVAARRTGPGGKTVGVDFSRVMIDRAGEAARECGAAVELHCAQAGDLPCGDDTADVVLANGIFNLNPRRSEIFRELFRVLRPGGKVFAAELVFQKPRKRGKVRSLKDWFA